jgi:hypothetical protein
MTVSEQVSYAGELLSSLTDENPEIEGLSFTPDRTQSRNASKAMTAILCHRLFKKSGHQPTPQRNITFEWKQGIFNSRNIADRGYFWTNMRRHAADLMHVAARNRPVTYLLAFCNPSSTTLGVWSIPEPLLYDSLPSLPSKADRRGYTLQIFPTKQRIKGYAASPDLAPYFREFPLSQQELLALNASRDVDTLVKKEKKSQRADAHDELVSGNGEDEDVLQHFDSRELIAVAEQQLVKADFFNPSGISDARDRIMSSIVRRRGQTAFRQGLLVAYNGRCAITACGLEDVLDAAHIIPYMGPETNHPANGLLLRTDLHTLFDLKLLAIDVATMTVLVSPSLVGTCYEEYRGRSIEVPGDPSRRPNREALEQHREECGF